MNKIAMLKIANDAYTQAVWSTLNSLNLPDMVKEAALSILIKEAVTEARLGKRQQDLVRAIKRNYPNALLNPEALEELILKTEGKDIKKLTRKFDALANPRNKSHGTARQQLEKLLEPGYLKQLERHEAKQTANNPTLVNREGQTVQRRGADLYMKSTRDTEEVGRSKKTDYSAKERAAQSAQREEAAIKQIQSRSDAANEVRRESGKMRAKLRKGIPLLELPAPVSGPVGESPINRVLKSVGVKSPMQPYLPPNLALPYPAAAVEGAAAAGVADAVGGGSGKVPPVGGGKVPPVGGGRIPTPNLPARNNALATIAKGGMSGRAKLLAGLGLLGTGAAAAYGLSGEEDQGLSNAELAALGIGGTAALGGGLYAANQMGAFS